MRFGHFDDSAREYVVTRPDTPLPWINYLGCEEYFALVSNTGGGYSFFRDPRLRRLTRYRYWNVPTDTGGRYLYVRDDETGEFWSPSWQPTKTDLDDYACRHGLGYTSIASARSGIEVETLYFVPLGETLEIWRTRIANRRSTPARLSLFSAVEFCLWDAWDDATNFQRNLSVGEVEVDAGVIYHTSEYRERRDHFAYFACSEPPAGFDTDRDAFLGPYRGWDRPLAVERGSSSDSLAHGWAPCGSHRVEIGLAPGETREIVFVLGYAENPREAKFDPPGSGKVAKRPGRGGALPLPRPRRGRAGVRAPPPALGRAARRAAGVDPERARRPDRERLEPVPVHGDVQPVAVGLALRERDRPGHGLPGLEPGPARLRPPRPRARTGAPARPRRDPASEAAAPTTSTSR